jgi:hypothetical protein
MAFFAFYSYASAFVGSMSFMAFALFAYQMGKPSDRTASYYQSRITYYGAGLTLAGLAQFLLGAYILSKFGSGPLLPAIGVAMFIVHWPQITVFVGLFQFFTGIFALLRRCGIMNKGKNDNRLQYSAFFMWIFMLSMQILTQVGYAPEGTFAPAAPSIACLSLGISMMSAYLDYKMRTMPEEFPVVYYGDATNAEEAIEEKEMALPADEEMGSANVSHEVEKDA